MSDTKQIIESMLKEYFGDMQKEISKKTAVVSQDFISRGLYNSTACTNALLGVYYDKFEKRIGSLFSFVDKKALALNWDYLEMKLHELAEQVCAKAKSQASQHLVSASLANLIASFHSSIDKKKSEIFGEVDNKIQLVSMLQASTAKQQDGDEYENILSIIRHAGKTYEETPKTYSSHNEEELRDIILAHLNGPYKGKAVGERFRKRGKTDITIEFDDRAAFVAECKIWRGGTELSKAIDQLLSYLTWRDRKTALVVFNKDNAGFKQIQDQIPEILQSHSNFDRLVQCDTDGEWRCMLNSKENSERKVIVHVFVFNLYMNE